MTAESERKADRAGTYIIPRLGSKTSVKKPRAEKETDLPLSCYYLLFLPVKTVFSRQRVILR